MRLEVTRAPEQAMVGRAGTAGSSLLASILSGREAKTEAGGGGAEEREAGVSRAGHKGRPLGTGQWREARVQWSLLARGCAGMSPLQICESPHFGHPM